MAHTFSDSEIDLAAKRLRSVYDRDDVSPPAEKASLHYLAENVAKQLEEIKGEFKGLVVENMEQRAHIERLQETVEWLAYRLTKSGA